MILQMTPQTQTEIQPILETEIPAGTQAKTPVKTPTCHVIKPNDSYRGKQALTYFSGVSTENTGAQGICMHLVTMPPGARAKAHLHEEHETAIYVLQGEGAMWYGDDLEEHCVTPAGSFIHIPAGVPHLPYNPSETETAVAVIARTDPNEQESVVLLPGLDAVHSPSTAADRNAAPVHIRGSAHQPVEQPA